MKLSTHFKFILITSTLILCVNSVNATKPDNSKNKDTQNTSSNPQTQSAQNKPNTPQSNQSGSTNRPSKPVTAEDFANQQTETLNCAYDFNYAYRVNNNKTRRENDNANNVLVFTYYSYQISKLDSLKISRSKAVTQFTFNGNALPMYDLYELPNRDDWGFARVFICPHNKPVMLRLKITEDDKNYHYYYALDEKAKKFKNVEISSLDEQSEKDKKGLTRHRAPTNPISEEFSKRIEKIWAKNFGKICQNHPQKPDHFKDRPTFSLTIVPSDEPVKADETRAENKKSTKKKTR